MRKFPEYEQAVKDCQEILASTHPDFTPGEKLVRVAWVIGNLPTEFRDVIIGEAQNRVGIGTIIGMSVDPTKP